MTKNYRYLIPVLALLAISCRNDDDSSDDVVVNEPDYIVSLRTQASSEETADYLVTSDDLMSGEITAEGQGTELLGWNFGGIFGGTYFSYTTQTDECYAYNTNSGSLPLQGRYLSSTSPDVLLPIDDNYFMAISAPWGGGSYDCTFDIVDINGVSVASSNTDPVYVSYDGNGVQMNAWPTGGYVEGDDVRSALRHIFPATPDCPEMSQHKNPKVKPERQGQQTDSSDSTDSGGNKGRFVVEVGGAARSRSTDMAAGTAVRTPESRGWRSKIIPLWGLTSES